ncbi:hypothetical protein PWT90_06392 [Aphanocladium album]|nr:hypothetical protein PWT90_06392 [Aphanocladium album]
MSLTTEAIIGIIALFLALPPVLVIVGRKLAKRRRRLCDVESGGASDSRQDARRRAQRRDYTIPLGYPSGHLIPLQTYPAGHPDDPTSSRSDSIPLDIKYKTIITVYHENLAHNVY